MEKVKDVSFEPFFENLIELFKARRDIRSFDSKAIPQTILTKLIESACLAPSVGLSEPWRFAFVKSTEKRLAVAKEFESQNLIAAEDYAPYAKKEYLRLKLAGLREAPVHLAIFCDDATQQGRGLGRKTMPESLEYSVVAAIQNFWLAARCLGIGVGWVSIIDPDVIHKILDTNSEWRLIAYLCVGYPSQWSDVPELERLGWESRSSLDNIYFIH